MKIEIYGIPENVWRCPGCHEVRGLLSSLSVDYEFIDVIQNVDGDIQYDRPTIESLAKRIGVFPSLSIRYPVIFVDDIKMYNIPYFKQKLIDSGYDRDLIED